MRQEGTNLIKTKVTAFERLSAWKCFGRSGRGAVSGHFLPRLVVMPFLALFLPFNEGVDLVDSDRFFDMPHIHGAVEKCVHVQLASPWAVAEELEDPLYPGHKLGEKAIIMQVDLVNESIKVFLMAGAEVNEGLDGLVGVCRHVLALSTFNHREHVVGERGEVCDTVVHIGRFVDADEGLVEYCEEVTEELKGHGLRGW